MHPGRSSTARSANGLSPAWRRASLATRIFAMSIDAANMGFGPYDPALKPMWGDPYDVAAIDALSELLAGAAMDGRREFQNPISWRILSRMIGHVLHAVE